MHRGWFILPCWLAYCSMLPYTAHFVWFENTIHCAYPLYYSFLQLCCTCFFLPGVVACSLAPRFPLITWLLREQAGERILTLGRLPHDRSPFFCALFNTVTFRRDWLVHFGTDMPHAPPCCPTAAAAYAGGLTTFAWKKNRHVRTTTTWRDFLLLLLCCQRTRLPRDCSWVFLDSLVLVQNSATKRITLTSVPACLRRARLPGVPPSAPHQRAWDKPPLAIPVGLILLRCVCGVSKHGRRRRGNRRGILNIAAYRFDSLAPRCRRSCIVPIGCWWLFISILLTFHENSTPANSSFILLPYSLVEDWDMRTF